LNSCVCRSFSNIRQTAGASQRRMSRDVVNRSWFGGPDRGAIIATSKTPFCCPKSISHHTRQVDYRTFHYVHVPPMVIRFKFPSAATNVQALLPGFHQSYPMILHVETAADEPSTPRQIHRVVVRMVGTSHTPRPTFLVRDRGTNQPAREVSHHAPLYRDVGTTAMEAKKIS